MYYEKPLDNTCSSKVFCMFKMSKKFCNKWNPARHIEKYMAVFWKGIMTKRTLLRKRWFELSRGFPMLFCAKCERNLNRKKVKEQHTDPWHGRINFIKKLPDMIICLKAAFCIKYWPSSFAIVSSMKSQFC